MDAQTETLIQRTLDRALEGFRAELDSALDRARAKGASGLANLPSDLGLDRILNTAATCEFLDVSPAHWRRLRAEGKAPAAVKIGDRINGWRIRTLIAWQGDRTQSPEV